MVITKRRLLKPAYRGALIMEKKKLILIPDAPAPIKFTCTPLCLYLRETEHI